MEGYSRRRGRPDRKQPDGDAGDDQVPPEDQGIPVVEWLPIRCPLCNGTDFSTDHTRGRLRYHTCAECRELERGGAGGRFKSWEIDGSP